MALTILRTEVERVLVGWIEPLLRLVWAGDPARSLRVELVEVAVGLLRAHELRFPLGILAVIIHIRQPVLPRVIKMVDRREVLVVIRTD